MIRQEFIKIDRWLRLRREVKRFSIHNLLALRIAIRKVQTQKYCIKMRPFSLTG